MDPLFLIGELAARQIYWRTPPLVEAVHRRRNRPRPPAVVERRRLQDHLSALGVVPGSLILLHSAISRIALAPPSGSGPPVANPLAVAAELLQDLIALVGNEGTLAMPTHPHYPDDPGFMADKEGLVLRYDPKRNPSRVGLLTEFFRRRPDVQRSLHPLSSVAARGPRAGELLLGNLDESEPLPHGVHSAYHHFCRLGGTVVSLGVPLIKSMTALHVAEEVRGRDWPVREFFCRRRFLVRVAGDEREWVVRERRPEFVRSLSLSMVRRDLLREGILRETDLCGIPAHAARAGDLLAFMMLKNRSSTYPYYLPALSRL